VHSRLSHSDPELAAEEPSRVIWEVEQQEGGYSLLTLIHDQLEGAPKTAVDGQIASNGAILATYAPAESKGARGRSPAARTRRFDGETIRRLPRCRSS
jgi:hypothetical protein